MPVWFITASSSGFGREIALSALQRGHTVIATARNPERIQDLAEAGAHVLAFDVTAPSFQIDDIAKRVFEQHGRVDYLINAAGFILEGAVEELTPDEVHQCFNTNVFGVINTIRAFLPTMRSQPLSPSGIRATVATFGSLGSWEGGASYAIYAMTKACASSLAESLRLELLPFKIRSTVVEPGYFRTSFLNPGAMKQSQRRISAYEDKTTPSGEVRKNLGALDGTQLGDVKLGSRVIVDILTGTGAGEGKSFPVRVVLGSDCKMTIRHKCSTTTQLLDDWKAVIESTDHS
ncbi:hypothetical protein CDD83_1742 [Cordyceps sp. RAO-2017]|nr:hypothetical protein CDD83_1742 [Cordyceps sp. RAO-2017]